jgi:hypothetical protein
MREVSVTKHLLARRFWRPLAQAVACVERQVSRGYDWLFIERKLERACLWMLSPLPRLHLWLCRKAGQARAPQLFRHSSLAYDLAAICAALLEPFAKWHAAARQRMKDETDPRLRGDDKPANRNGEHKRDDHEQH